MLYKFHCKKSADVFMLGDLTQKIFDIIGRPLEDKGVFLLEQIPTAIAKLEEAIAQDLELRKASVDDNEMSSEKAPAKSDRLGQRAFPFIKLLKEALANNEMVIWGV
jgi:Domain of unknown function (DUF1840)